MVRFSIINILLFLVACSHSKPETINSNESVKTTKTVPPALQAIFDDPEIKLFDKTNEELESSVKQLINDYSSFSDSLDRVHTGISNKEREKAAKVIVPILKLQILQKTGSDETKEDIELLIKHADRKAIRNLVKEMEKRYRVATS